MDSQPTVGHSSSDSITFSMPSLSIRYPGAPLRPATKGSALMLVEENQKTAETSGRLSARARSIASASRSFSSETSSLPLCCASKLVDRSIIPLSKGPGEKGELGRASGEERGGANVEDR